MCHGLYLLRDTDSEGLDSNPDFPEMKFNRRELGEELNEKVAELYKEIFANGRLSEQLLLVIKNQISSYTN